MSNLDLRTREGMLKGGTRGAAVIPGDASESRVYLQISGMEGPVMPMGGALSDDEILTLKDWINQGAKLGCRQDRSRRSVGQSRRRETARKG